MHAVGKEPGIVVRNTRKRIIALVVTGGIAGKEIQVAEQFHSIILHEGHLSTKMRAARKEDPLPLRWDEINNRCD